MDDLSITLCSMVEQPDEGGRMSFEGVIGRTPVRLFYNPNFQVPGKDPTYTLSLGGRPLTSLFQRRSASGNVYYHGKWGETYLSLFSDKYNPGNHNLLLRQAEAKPRQETAPAPVYHQRPQVPEAPPVARRKVTRRHAVQATGDEKPFVDDSDWVERFARGEV